MKALIWVFLVTIAVPAQAQIIVNTLQDEWGTGPDCSLREALEAANNDIPYGGCTTGVPGVDEIDVAVEGNIFLSSSNDHLQAAGDVIVTAQNLTITGAPDTRILLVSTGRVEVSGIEFRDGQATLLSGDPFYRLRGGAVYIAADGWGIFTDCSFRNNRSNWRGGAIYVGGQLTLLRTIVEDNHADQGSGIFGQDADIGVFDSAITGNQEIDTDNGNGGGIWCSGATSFLLISRSEISNNVSSIGGGLYTVSCPTLMVNSTVSGNDGGGGWFADGPTQVSKSTITNNDTRPGWAGFQGTPQFLHEIYSSIIAGNRGLNDFASASATSLGYNHFGFLSASTTGIADGVNNDRVGIDPLLGPLDSNGGFARSHLPMAGSPSIDSGDCFQTGTSTDQRRLPRVVDVVYNDGNDPVNVSDGCDVGSVEVQQNEIPDFEMDLKAFLHGPYDIGLMNDTGSSTVAIDTVLVQVRNPIDRADVFASRQAIVMENGSIKGLNNAPNFLMNGFPPGLNHVSIDHRNHLAIMTKDPVNIDAFGMSFDFTASLAQAYGLSPMIETNDGNFALWGGDGDQNESVTAFDFIDVWLPQNGIPSGYHQGDFNLDGEVTAFDFLRVWLPANGRDSQVP